MLQILQFSPVGSEKQERRLVLLTPLPNISFLPSLPLHKCWSTQNWSLDNTSSVGWWNTSQTPMIMYVFVGWFIFLIAIQVRSKQQ